MNWELIALIIITLLLLVAGGYIKRLTREVKDLVDVFSAAIDDRKISRVELEQIVKEAREVGACAKDIITAVTGLIIKKRNP